MKTATLGQVRKVLGLLDRAPQEQVQALLESGLLSDLLSANLAEVNRNKFRGACGLLPIPEASRITIDRSRPFDPASIGKKGWSIAEQDERSLALREIDLNEVRLFSIPNNGMVITGEERLRRLKQAGHIRLDIKIFQMLCGRFGLIPEHWELDTICFDGTIFLDLDGRRRVFYLERHDNHWGWHYDTLDSVWYIGRSSAVLASV